MRICTKKQDGRIEFFSSQNLFSYLQPSGSVIGFCPSLESTSQYLFSVSGNELRRYSIRANTKTAAQYYAVVSHNDFCPEKLSVDRAPQISDSHFFFTADEMTQLVAEEKQCPCLAESALSREQQELLYSGVVVPGLGISFYHFLQAYIFTLPDPEKVLLGAITKMDMQFSEDDKQGKSALDSLRYNFLAPNRIVFFDQRLYPNKEYEPTVGSVLDFYTHCIQTALRKLCREIVSSENIRIYSDRSRAAKLGDQQYHFTEDGIHYPQGLTGVDDIIFRFISLLLVPENQSSEQLKKLFENHSDFFNNKIAIFRAVIDLIVSIENNSMTQIRSYLPIYDYMDALLPKEGWRDNLLSHLKTAQKTFLTLLSASDVILHDIRLKAEEGIALTQKLEGKEYNGVIANTLIHVVKCGLPVTDLMISEVSALYDSSGVSFSYDFVEVLSLLHKAAILNESDFHEIKDLGYKVGSLRNALIPLARANILNRENFDFIKTHKNLLNFGVALRALDKKNILTKINFDAIRENKNSGDFLEIILLLSKFGILNQENFDAIKIHPNIISLYNALFRVDPLTQESFDEYKTHYDPHTLLDTFRILRKANIASPENCNAVKSHQNLSGLYRALDQMNAYDSLHQKIFDEIKTHPDPWSFVSIWISLSLANILTPENLSAVKNHHNLPCLCDVFGILSRNVKILNQPIFSEIMKCENISDLAKALYSLRNKDNQFLFDILNQNRNAILMHKNLLGCINAIGIINEYKTGETAGLFSPRNDASNKIIQALQDYVNGDTSVLEKIVDIQPNERLKNILKEKHVLTSNDTLDIRRFLVDQKDLPDQKMGTKK